MTRRVLACVRMSPWIEDFRVLPGAVLREHGNEKAPRPELCARGIVSRLVGILGGLQIPRLLSAFLRPRGRLLSSGVASVHLEYFLVVVDILCCFPVSHCLGVPDLVLACFDPD